MPKWIGGLYLAPIVRVIPLENRMVIVIGIHGLRGRQQKDIRKTAPRPSGTTTGIQLP